MGVLIPPHPTTPTISLLFYTFRFDLPNHWFVVLRNRLQYVSVEKCRDGIVIQISRNKNTLIETLMGSPRLATTRNRSLQAEVNMPYNLSVSM